MVRAGKGNEMTLLDRFKKDHPDMNPDEAVFGYCPEDFGYNRPNTGCDAIMEPDGEWGGCESCWNQEEADSGGQNP